MTDRDALLCSIVSAPHEDTPRLIYADFLEENGDGARAEFIRDCIFIQNWTDCPIRLADLKSGRPVPLRCGSCDYCAARRRAEKFYARNQWVDAAAYAVAFEPTPLDGTMPTGPGLTLIVRRGFIDSIQCSWADWLRHRAAIYWHPDQEVPCVDCDRLGKHPDCSGRTPRPFVPSCQPLTTVRLTAADIHTEGSPDWLRLPSGTGVGIRFDRVKCSTCAATGWHPDECPKHPGSPLNEWTCEAWPQLVFEMPELSVRGVRGRISVNRGTHDAPNWEEVGTGTVRVVTETHRPT